MNTGSKKKLIEKKLIASDEMSEVSEYLILFPATGPLPDPLEVEEALSNGKATRLDRIKKIVGYEGQKKSHQKTEDSTALFSDEWFNGKVIQTLIALEEYAGEAEIDLSSPDLQHIISSSIQIGRLIEEKEARSKYLKNVSTARNLSKRRNERPTHTNQKHLLRYQNMKRLIDKGKSISSAAEITAKDKKFSDVKNGEDRNNKINNRRIYYRYQNKVVTKR